MEIVYRSTTHKVAPGSFPKGKILIEERTYATPAHAEAGKRQLVKRWGGKGASIWRMNRKDGAECVYMSRNWTAQEWGFAESFPLIYVVEYAPDCFQLLDGDGGAVDLQWKGWDKEDPELTKYVEFRSYSEAAYYAKALLAPNGHVLNLNERPLDRLYMALIGDDHEVQDMRGTSDLIEYAKAINFSYWDEVSGIVMAFGHKEGDPPNYSTRNMSHT